MYFITRLKFLHILQEFDMSSSYDRRIQIVFTTCQCLNAGNWFVMSTCHEIYSSGTWALALCSLIWCSLTLRLVCQLIEICCCFVEVFPNEELELLFWFNSILRQTWIEIYSWVKKDYNCINRVCFLLYVTLVTFVGKQRWLKIEEDKDESTS